MKNRSMLKKILGILSMGWALLLVSLVLFIFFPEIVRPAAIFTIGIGMLFSVIGFIGSMVINNDDLFWESLDRLDKEYEEMMWKAKRAVAYKNVYKNLIIEKYGEDEKKLKGMADIEMDKL